MIRKSRLTLVTIMILVIVIASGAMGVLADDGLTTDAIAGTWYGNMHFSVHNAVERVMLTIPAGCEAGNLCGTMLNYVNRCVWEITYDGYSDGAYSYHFSNTLKGACPSGTEGTLTLMADGSLYRVHATPLFTSEGALNKLPHQ
jgi:hypothetical protein